MRNAAGSDDEDTRRLNDLLDLARRAASGGVALRGAEGHAVAGKFWLCPGFLAAYAAVASHMALWHTVPTGTGKSSNHELIAHLAGGYATVKANHHG